MRGYAVSRFGMENLAEVELPKPESAPGMVQTEFSAVRFRGDEERAAKVYQNITPLQPEDVADAIVWAASRPEHVNIHNVLMTTIDQANSVTFNRRG